MKNQLIFKGFDLLNFFLFSLLFGLGMYFVHAV